MVKAEVGAVYKNKEGRRYRVIAIGESTDDPKVFYVCYMDCDFGKMWACRKDEFEDGSRNGLRKQGRRNNGTLRNRNKTDILSAR